LEGNGARTEGAKLYPEHDDARDHDQSPNEFAGQETPSIEVPQRIGPVNSNSATQDQLWSAALHN
jgi:hypothetical protein